MDSVLTNIDPELFATTDLALLLQKILDQLVLVVPYDSASIILLHGERPEIVASRGFRAESQKVITHDLLEKLSHIQQILSTGKPELIPDTTQDPRWLHLHGDEYIQCWLGVPLLANNQVIGVLNIDNTRPNFYTEHYTRLAQSFAEKAAIAIANARLVSELRKTKENLVALLSSTFDAVIAIDPDQKITVFNRQAEKLLGYSAGEMIGKNVIRLHKNVKNAREIYRLLNDQGEIEGYHVVLINKQGQSIPVLLSAKAIRDNGNILGQVGFLKDLRETELLETRLRSLVESAKVINSARSLHDVLVGIIEAALAAFPNAERGSIHLFDEDEQLLKLQITNFNFSLDAKKALGFKPGEGIAGWVYANEEPLVLPDSLKDSRYKLIEHPEVKPHRAMICTLLRARDKKVGVLTLSHLNNIKAFKAEDLGLLTSFADQAAIAIENARQFETLESETHDRSLLQRISTRISAHTDIKQVLAAICEGGQQLLGAEMVVVHLKDPETGAITSMAVPEEMESLMTEPRDKAGLTGTIMKAGEPLVIQDTSQDVRVNPSVVKKGIRSLVGYPLRVRGQPIGVLYLNSRFPRRFGEREIELLSLLVGQAAVAIENAWAFERLGQLFEEISASNKRLQDAYSASHQIISSQEPSEALHTIVDRICHVVNAAQASVVRIDEDGIPRELAASGSLTGASEELPARAGKITRRIIRSGEPVFISDTLKEKDQVSPWILTKGIRAFAGLPLEHRGTAIGVLWVNYAEEHPFSDNEMDVLRLYSNLAAIAYENSRLLDQVKKTNESASLVAEVTLLGELDATLESIVQGTHKALGCDIVTLYRYDQERKLVIHPPKWAGVRDESKILDTGIVSLGSAPYKIIAQDKLLHYANNTEKDSLLNTPFAAREGVKSSAGVKLVAQDRIVGVMFVNYREGHHFSPAELDNLRLFAHQAAIAIQNAVLYEAQHERARALIALNQAGQALAKSLEQDEIVKQVVRQAWELTGYHGTRAKFTDILLVEEDKLKFVSAYPESAMEQIRSTIGEQIYLQAGVPSGITGRAVRTGTSQLIQDVTIDPDYIVSHPDTRSELAVPIKLGNAIIGAINVEHSEIGAFDEEDQRDLETLAAYAAVAINNAQQFTTINRQKNYHEAVYDAGKEIIERLTAPRNEILELILVHAVRQIQPAAGGQVVLGAVQIHEKSNHTLRLECVWPRSALEDYKIGEIRPLSQSRTRIGVSGRAVIQKVSQLVPDVSIDPDYVQFNQGTKSELDVPLLMGEEVLGVISLECDQLNGFDLEDQHALESLAELAVIAIENARRYQELREAKQQVGAMTALTWMGTVEGAWRHTVRNLAAAIVTHIANIQLLLKQGGAKSTVGDNLQRILKIADEIQDIQMPPLSSEAGVESVKVNLLLRDRLDKIKRSRYGAVEFTPYYFLDDKATVRASPEWLRRLLDILIDNGVNAAAEKSDPRIEITTQPMEGGAQILVSDNGSGIPESIRKRLFIAQIEKKPGEKGSGLGLFLAQAIVQTYKGKLEIARSDSSGTTMALWFPLEKPSG